MTRAQRAWSVRYNVGVVNQPDPVTASINNQHASMDTLAWRVTYEWNRAKNRCLTMDEMQTAWRDSIAQSAHYQCLADKRKETINFLWHHTQNRILAENQIYGYWYEGAFYSNWSDLPESVRYNEELLKNLPVGHFWLDGNRKATTIRYFIGNGCRGEEKTHFPAN
jgi:hypothetical protein